MTVLRLQVLAAIVVLTVTVRVIGVKPAPTAAVSRAPTVANYLVRIARAQGLEGRVGPRARADEYLRLLVLQGVLPAAAQGLRTDQRLTSDFALEVSSRISDPL